MDDGHVTAAADGWALGVPEVRRRTRGGASTARDDLHPPAPPSHRNNYRGPGPIGGVQGGGEEEREFEPPHVVATGDGPGGGRYRG